MIKKDWMRRGFALLLAFAMVVGYFPAPATAAQTRDVAVTGKVSDAVTMDRFDQIYGNDTYHSGKVTVDKSVSAESVNVEGQTFAPSSDENFIVTVSQAAQVMALTTEMATPVDVVFVIDTTGSMAATVADNNNKNRTQTAVEVVNETIAQLMAANENNRVGVVAFSAYNAGGVDAGGNAANVLSGLSHYTGAAAAEHLTWDTRRGQGPSWYTDVALIRGRNADGSVGKGRAGTAGATNIQAGLATGASLLMNSDTTVNIDGQKITRMPFLILLSDGAPVASSSNNDWWNPSMTLSQGTNGDPLMAGNSFLPMLVASYYKDKISDRYYPNHEDSLSIYTVGFAVDADETDMAAMTLNPKAELTNTRNDYQSAIAAAWNSYSNNRSFSIDVGVPAELLNNNNYSHDGKYYFYHEDTEVNIRNVNDVADNLTKYTAEQYYGIRNGNVTFEDNIDESIVPADKSISALAYNDGYYDATNADGLQAAFESIFTEIAKKSISAPTQVTTTEEFDGYVTFTDVIGEYMEVKDMKGILADGRLYQGAYAARAMSGAVSDAEFNASLLNVIGTRMNMTASSGITAAGLISAAATNNTYNGEKTQAYWNSNDDFDNSLVWWGKTYSSGDNFETHVQTLGHAVDDSIAYITDPTTVIPEGANVVCRSYFFYGTAGQGSAAVNPNHDYLYFVVRVQRSLVAPYQQTVTISAPASLLSMEKVYITEDKTGNTTTYTAEVEEAQPAHVVYEVGLRSDINEYNVDQMVGTASENYVDGQYVFYTNDWDPNGADHEKAMSKATFYAADNNPYYTYQENTYLYNASGTILNGATAPAGEAYYYRDVYTWGNTVNSDGERTATKSRELVKVNIPAGAGIVKDGTGWYIPAGAYTASVISPDAEEERLKDYNATGSAVVVAHPHRTGDADDAHYTVYLGNNGKLSLRSVRSKDVDIESTAQIYGEDGKAVMVGDTLTYKIDVTNTADEAVVATVTDEIPTGTVYIDGTAKVLDASGDELDADDYTVAVANGVITWNFHVPKDTTYYATFQVKVDESALTGLKVTEDIENTASIQLGNNPAYNTNTVHNPPEGKKLVDTDGNAFDEGETVKVGDVLVYRIRYANDSDSEADVIIEDTIPRGTTYVDGSADKGGALMTDGDGNLVLDETTGKPKLQWTIEGVEPHTSGFVSFRVYVDASAKADWTEGATQPDAADTLINIPNQAKIGIKIGENDPTYRYTNIPEIDATVGNLKLNKVVESGDADETFTLILTESEGKLDGTYKLTGGNADTVTFTKGTAEITIKNGQIIEIHGLPAGAKLTLDEKLEGMNGWSAEYSKTSLTIVNGTTEIEAAKVTNNYNPTPVKFQLKGTKSFTGTNFPAGTFTFTAQECDSTGAVVENGISVSATATADQGQTADVEFVFSERTFTEAFDRYYLITENATDLNGVTVDTKQYLLRLVVTDNDGQLVLTETLWSRDNENSSWTQVADFDSTEDKVAFTNAYKPKETSVTISGTKTLTGRKLNANEFSFQLVDPTRETGKEVIATAENNADGSFSFHAIPFTAAGEYTYYVRETVGSLAHVDYDRTYYEVKVTVTDNGGNLEAATVINRYDATKTETDGNVSYTYPSTPSATNVSIAYQNVYNTQDTQITLSGTKTLSGAAANGLKAEDFTFVVLEATADWTATDNIVATAGNGADAEAPYVGAISFSPINFTRAMMGDQTEKYFYYIVKEVVPASTEPSYDVNMKYDTREYHLTVKVTLGSDGILNAKIVKVDSTGDLSLDSYNALHFENIKNPAEVSFTPSGLKITKGSNLPANLHFSFRVTDLNGNVEGTGISASATGSDAGDTITFTALVYDASDVGNTYYYIIEEATVSMSDGVTYSQAKYVLAVTISRNANGALVATGKYYNYDADAANKVGSEVTGSITFENAYNAEKILNITANKALSGRTLGANEFDFRFQLLSKNADGTYSLANSVVNGTNAADGKVTFGTLNFTQNQMTDAFRISSVENAEAGTKTETYRYVALMGEIKPSGAEIPGVTYDTNKYIVMIDWSRTMPISGTGDHTLSDPAIAAVYKAVVNVDGDNVTYSVGDAIDRSSVTDSGNTGVTFNNSYAVVHGTSATIVAKKTLTGRDLSDGEFSFGLYRNDTLIETATNLNGVATFVRNYPATMSEEYFTNDGDGNDNTATLIYKLVEENTGEGGVTYSTAVYWVKVVIEHEQDSASLKIKSIGYYTDEDCTAEVAAANVVFANTYKAKDTTFTPAATKELVERDLKDGEFNFQVVELDPENGYAIKKISSGSQFIDKVVATGTSDATGKVTFTHIGYQDNDADTTDDVYYYLIREVKGTDTTITYDPTVYYLKVTVSNDGEGNLTATGAYYSDKFVTPVNAVKFVNHYGPGSVDLTLDLKKTVKISHDENAVYALKGSEFDFNVYEYVEGDTDYSNNVVVTTGTNGATNASGIAPITFGSIVINKEQLTDKTGTFKYVILEAPLSGESDKGISIDSEAIIVTVTVTDDGYGNLTATYAYEQNGVAGDQTFVNEYEADPATIDLTAIKTLHNKDLKADEFSFELKDSTGATIQTVKNKADGTVTFNTLTFNAPGTYTYTVSETKGNTTGMTYDAAVYTVTVVVTDNGEGKLIPTVSYKKGEDTVGGISFVNSYTPPAITEDLDLQINATKEVVDPSGDKLTGDYLAGFHFEVVDVSGNVVSTGTSDANGKIDFDAFTFDKAGEYHYIIREVDEGDKPGYTLDTNSWSVYILVRYDSAKGELYINDEDVVTHPVSSSAQDADAHAQAEQTPVFVNKYNPAPTSITLKAKKELTGRPLKNHEFTFRLMEGNLIEAESMNHADGTISFTVDYNEPGEHTYTIVEVIPAEALGGVTYDYTTYSVKVTVTDTDGVLKATATQVDNQNFVVGAVFKNTYLTDGATAKIEGTKTLVGKELKAQEFSFVLKDAAGNEIQTVQNNADGTFAFSELSFENAGVYTYTVSEVAGTLPGMVYDNTVHTVTITVSDNEAGKLVANVAYSGEKLEFKNTYNTPAVLTLSGVKTMDGKTPANGKFTFTLADAKGNVIDTVTNSGDKFTFKPLEFAATGEYVYIVTETKGNDKNVIYDATEYHVHVTVGLDEANHKYVASYTVGIPSDEHTDKDAAGIVFANVTRDAVNVHLHATKTLEHRHLTAGEFTFILKDADGNVLQTKTNAADGKVTFDALSFNAADTYTYYISEQPGTDAFIKYDAKEYKAVITVTAPDQAGPNANGAFEATVTYYLNNEKITGADFTNKPSNAPMNFSFKKVDVNGAAIADAEFTLTHVNCKDCILYDGQQSYVAVSDANGVVSFTGIPSGHQYLLSETKTPANFKTTPDRHVTDIYGVVYIDGEEVTYDDQNNPLLEIVNVPANATEIILAGTKIMLDADGNQILAENNAFTFELYKDEIKEENKLDTQHNMETAVVPKTSVVESEFFFHSIPLTAVGEYKYIIREVKGTDPDVVYSSETYEVVVNVDKQGDDLYIKSVTVNGKSVEADAQGVFHLEEVITFTNQKRTPAKVTLNALKKMAGNTTEIGDRVFTFYLKEDGETLQTKQNGADGKVAFDELIFDEAGTYRYTIVEQAGNDPYIDYDKTVHNVEIVVKPDAQKGYTVTVNGETDMTFTFTNTLTDRGFAMLELLKVDEAGQPLTGVEFTLTHNCDDGCTAKFDPITAVSREDGMVIFSHIHSGHSYTLSETKGPEGYVKTADRTVVVTYGKVTVDGVPFTEGTPINVVNYYVGQLGIVGMKHLEGKTLNAGDYSFELYETGADFTIGEDQKAMETVTNKADGSFAFTALTYDEAGTYHYVVKEIAGTDPNMDYDPAEYYVTVTVTADDETGELTPAVSVVKNAVLLAADDVVNNDQDDIVFHNVYVPSEPAAVELSGTKELTGRDIRDGEFTFVLTDADGNEVEKVTNTGKTFSFKALKFDAEGTYEYKIAEIKGTDAYITYDQAIYEITIQVTDNGNRQLIAATTITKDDEAVEAVAFTNAYNPDAARVVLEGTKTLTGRTMKAEEFSFQLMDKDGKVLQIVDNGTDGKFAFAELTFTEEGTYTYTITEVKGNLEGVTYDESVYTVTVTVEDNKEGKLVATVVYTKDDKAAETIAFANTYKPETTGIILEGTKTLTGRDLKAGEFSFQLMDKNGNVLQTVANDANGKFAFAEITCTGEGTYTYTVSEVKGDLAGIAYDESVYTVTVTVKDNENGDLVATVVYAKDGVAAEGIAFANTYDPDVASVILEGTKTLYGRTLKADEFTFQLLDKDGKVVRTVSNGANGKFTFGTITFTEAGTYTYTVKEVKGNVEGVTYDTTVYTITVTVADNQEGELTATYVITKNGKAVDGLVFVNSYKEAPKPTRPSKPSNNPQTGDESGIALWSITAIGTMLALALMLLQTKKSKGRFEKR